MDEQKVADYLYNIGYFRLSAYFYPLLKFPKEQHHYKAGSTFTQALNMYRFDRKLRLLLFNEIEKIEIAIRSCIINAASEFFNDLFWITNICLAKQCNTTMAISRTIRRKFLIGANFRAEERNLETWLVE